MESQDLRKAGLKVTHPRVRILAVLEDSEHPHLTAEDIYRALMERGDDIGLATVYRVLTQFEAAGLVLKHNFEGGQAVYELDRGGHHDHMVDVESGRLELREHAVDGGEADVVAALHQRAVDVLGSEVRMLGILQHREYAHPRVRDLLAGLAQVLGFHVVSWWLSVGSGRAPGLAIAGRSVSSGAHCPPGSAPQCARS